MPLRSDPRAWWNLPGVVAAFQPVRCPGGSLLARYNMAHGGDNRYRAVPGVAPTWAAVTGWTFNGSTQYLSTGLTPSALTWTYVIRVAGCNTGAFWKCAMGTVTASQDIGLWPEAGGPAYHMYKNGHADAVYISGAIASGVMAIAGVSGYLNGVLEGTHPTPTPAAAAYPLWIGAKNASGSADGPLDGRVLAVAVYARTLAAAEVWAVSRQMAYCDVNPEWSVWSPRRRWFYVPDAVEASTATIFRRVIGNLRSGSRGITS